MSKLKVFVVCVILFGTCMIVKLAMMGRVPGLNFGTVKISKLFPEIRDACEPKRQNSSVEDLLCMDTPNFLKNYKNPCWMENKKTLRCLPYFYLIGNAKCGTSDFFKRILMHPDIVKNKGSLNKETAYWSRRRFGYVHAEMKAIVLALDLAEESNHNNFIIFSDSLLTLQALHKMHLESPTVCDTFERISHLRTSKEFVFRWIPGRHGGRYIAKATFNWFLNMFDAKRLQSVKNDKGYHYQVTGVGDPMDFYDRYHDNWMPQNERDAEELQWTTIHAIKHLNPNVKLLLMLRDPVERLYSYYFFAEYGNSSEQFHRDTIQSIGLWKDCLKRHSERHCIYSRELEVKYNCPIYPGLYNVHLREWLKVFPRKQILIFRTEDYEKDIRGTMINVFRYLNMSIPDDTILRKMSVMKHFRITASKRKAGAMLNETRRILVDFYRPYLKDLVNLLNDDRYTFSDVNFK